MRPRQARLVPKSGRAVIDAKSGRPSPHHAIQVMIYMYALPRALERYRGLALSGQVAYPDHVVDIPAAAVDEGPVFYPPKVDQRSWALPGIGGSCT